MTPQLKSNIPTEQQLGQAISSDAQKEKVFYNVRTNSQFNDSSVFLKELQFWECIKGNMLDMLIASSVLKDQKGSQLSHTLNRTQHQNTHQHKAAAPTAHQLMSVVCATSSWKKFAQRGSTGGKTQVNTAGISTRVHHTLQLRAGKLLLYFFKKYTRKKESCLFLSYAPFLKTTNPFKDF